VGGGPHRAAIYGIPRPSGTSTILRRQPVQDNPTSTDPIHRFSSLGRPLDPAFATNRAVLVLMPVAAAVFAVAGPWTPGLAGTARVWAALLGAGTVLGTWALGRELTPDDQRAAFVGMGLGVVVLLTVPGASLVLLFATLVLVRLVNRSVGLPPRLLDAVAIVALIGWSMWTTQSAWVGVVAAAAFGIDAVLPGGLLRHWAFAALSLVLTAVPRDHGRDLSPPLQSPKHPRFWCWPRPGFPSRTSSCARASSTRSGTRRAHPFPLCACGGAWRSPWPWPSRTPALPPSSGRPSPESQCQESPRPARSRTGHSVPSRD
jgi:hypothetical protein